MPCEGTAGRSNTAGADPSWAKEMGGGGGLGVRLGSLTGGVCLPPDSPCFCLCELKNETAPFSLCPFSERPKECI